MKKIFLFVLLIAVPALAQEEVPDFYEDVFSLELLAAVSAVIAITKLVRNALGDIKGPFALAITFAVAIGYGFFQYGINGHPWWYGVLSGLLAALSFYITKNTGKLLFKNPAVKGLAGKLEFLVTRKERHQVE